MPGFEAVLNQQFGNFSLIFFNLKTSWGPQGQLLGS